MLGSLPMGGMGSMGGMGGMGGQDTMSTYNGIWEKCRDGAPGAQYDAYGGGETHDPFGKKYFHNMPVAMDDEYHVAIVTPTIHYCMGGLEIDANSLVVAQSGKPIKGLYAAGEIAGGVHGNNRLGGNSLLDCVVFGRVAGKHCAEYMLGETVPTSLAQLSGAMKAGGAAAPVAAAAAPAAPAPAAVAGYSLDEVAKHTTKEDCWVVVNGQVLNVTKFLPDPPGGELAILTFAGKDGTAEFDMIHPPDVISKYAPDAVIGVLGAGAPAAAPAATGGAGAPLLDKPAAAAEPGFLSSLASAIYIPGDRASLTRSAFFLIFFIVVHAIGNLHVFLGPDDFNGYGFFYVRLYWTGFGLNANIVEEYVAFAAVLHVVVALKRTYDINLGYSVSSGKLNLAISGVLLLIYMTIPLFQFRFGLTQPYWVRPPPYLINIWELPHLFWTSDPSIALVPVRDIYKLEFDLFQDTTMVLYYVCMVFVFS